MEYGTITNIRGNKPVRQKTEMKRSGYKHLATTIKRRVSSKKDKKTRRTLIINLHVPKPIYPFIKPFGKKWVRIFLVAMAGVLLLGEFLPIFQANMSSKAYAMGSASELLPTAAESMANKINFDTNHGVYNFNAGYNPGATSQSKAGGAHISVVAYKNASKGVEVTDPINQIGLQVKPEFSLLDGQKQQNRIVYPLADGTGWVVYTMQADAVKEDVLLSHANGDKMTLKYNLELGDSLEAKLMPNGGIGVYGSSLPINGNVSTGSDKDAQLLQKVRQKATKDQLLFVIPAPLVNEHSRTKSSVKANYELKGNELTLKVSGLKKSNYPLTIDPSVYVTSAQQFMMGNNETNIDYDTSYALIQKGKLTGARISGWTADLALNAARWSSGYATGGGYAYVVGGSNGGTNQSNIYWAQFGLSDNTIDPPPNPGPTGGGCDDASKWCTNSAYNLPAARSGLSAVVYNGYLYAIGGTDSSCAGTNSVCSTVYKAKLGANGEPISWSTTSSLVTGRRFAGVAAYNNHLYIVGGQTNASLNGEQSVEYATINPNGSLSTWATTTSIPTAGRWGATVLQNNGYLYLIGGASTTTAAATVQYIKINSDGTLASSWVTTSSFTRARMAFGGNFATIYNGYLYITSGCATLTTTACSTFTPVTFTSVTVGGNTFDAQSDFQYANINADGSTSGFTVSARNPYSTPVVNGTPLQSASSTAMTGYGLVAWRGALYGIGGCTAVSTATNCSGTTQTRVQYGTVNGDGDVSQVFGSTNSDFYNTTNYLSDLPAAGTGAGQGGRIATGVVVNNGYIYNVGGCANLGCTTMTRNSEYAVINSDGTLGNWTVDSTNLLPAGLGAMGITVHNNVIYTVGGFTGAADTQNVYHSVLNSNGTLSAWVNEGALASTTAGYIFTFARAVPNNATQSYLYMIGGCNGTTGIGCTTTSYVETVRRCTITNGGSIVAGSCTTTGQLQLLTGTGIFGGAVYGDYIYLAGGANGLSGTNVSPTGATCNADPHACGGQMDIIEYAFINSSGNITRTDGTTITGGWHVASSRLTEERRRTVAFGANGYLYVVAGHNGTVPAHTLNDIQRGKINVATGDVTNFTILTTAITYRWDLRAAQANGYIYILGGCTVGPPPTGCTEMNGVNEYVQIYNNWSASPASYTSSGNLFASDRYGGAATVLNGYLYIAGGCTSTASDCSSSGSGTATTDVSYALLGADGSIGSWTSATNGLPAGQPRAFGRLENVGGTLYYIGGQTSAGVAQTTVYYSTPSGGAPAVWQTASNGLPAGNAKSQFSTEVYNNRIYAVGGFSGTNATPTATVYYSPNLSAGGDIGSAWTSTTSFNLARSGESVVAYGNNLYVMGGFNGTNYLLDTQFAPISSNGSVGTWVYGTSLPQLVRQGDAFATNGFIYLFGGRSAASTCTNNTYDVPVNADGSIGVWSQTNVKYTTTRWGVAAAYDTGRAYLLGGVCGSTLTAANRAVYGTLQLQPQLAKYSLMIDADTNVFPQKYLANGLDNGIGASWYLLYQSAADVASPVWGQSTNAGQLTLGTPGTYTPLDGSGTNLNLSTGARYYFLFFTIDDQKAFGYPEDVTRGPTLNDITLEFTSDPGKRLRNGKTFIHGEQQPLDTPF